MYWYNFLAYHMAAADMHEVSKTNVSSHSVHCWMQGLMVILVLNFILKCCKKVEGVVYAMKNVNYFCNWLYLLK